MYQEMLEDTLKNAKEPIDQDVFEWNLAHAMYYLSLTQVHLSGSISNLLHSKKPTDQKAAREIFKAIKGINNLFEPAKKMVDYNKLSNDLAKTANIVTMVLDRIDYLGQIAGYLQNDANFKPRRRKEDHVTS